MKRLPTCDGHGWACGGHRAESLATVPIRPLEIPRGGLLKPSESGSHVWAWLWERLFPSDRHRTWGLDSSPNHSMRGCSSRHRAKISLPQEERGWFSLSNNNAAAHSSFGKVGALGSSDVCGWESKERTWWRCT